MNVIPKFQQGGSFDAFFTEYRPIQTQAPKRSQQREPRSQGSSKGNDDNEKGKLTEKDLFTMIKDIDGLPNEMRALVTNLMNTFQMSNLTGTNINSLATTYLSNLYQLKIAQQNKAKYDASVKNASQNGAMQEPAISTDGKLIVQTEDGEVRTIGLETYFNNKDKYSPLTVSNIAHLRAYDSDFNNNQTSFDIINNSMGFESFQKLVETAKANLGSTEYTRNGYFSAEGQASKGLQLIQRLKQEGVLDDLDIEQLGGSVTAEGLYDYKIIDKDQLQQIKALTSYISALFPDRAKTWAAWKLQTPDKNKATQNLVLQYLLSGQTTSHSIDITYHGTMDHAMSKTKDKSGSSKEEDPKEGFWRQVQSGKGGTDSSYNIIINNTSMSLTGGKYYGAVPGSDTNCSLGDYIFKSGLGYLRTDKNGITFGNIEISPDSFDDVMVNTRSGAYAITLPTRNGKVWLEAVEVYNNFKKDLKKSGLNPGTDQYNLKVKQLLKNPEYSALAPLIQSDGELNPNNSAHFLVLEGITSNKASGISNSGNKQSISDFNNNFIVEVGDDKELYRTVQEGLSSKERGEYKLDYNEWYDVLSWVNRYDKLYKGNIYIPLNTNPINAMNADSNDIKASIAQNYEEMQQEWNIRSNSGSTGSNVLQQ